MSDFNYSSWMAYEETDGSQTSPLGSFGRFSFWYGENGSNEDGALPDDDDGGPGDNQWEGVVGSGGSDQATLATGGTSGGAGNNAPLSFYGTIDISTVTYPVFQDAISGDFVLFAQSDNELPSSITVSDIQLASNGAVFPFCFVEGTWISTPQGERRVETLRIGDLVRTADGRAVPVRWIGRQRVHGNAFLRDERLAPVCITTGALGNHSDLYVSANHGMIVRDHVVNASALVDGAAVRFASADELPAEYTYYHIETEAHDAIIANGAAAESFIDAASRKAFDNHAEYLELYGVERITPEMPLPRITAARLMPEDLRAWCEERFADCGPGTTYRQARRHVGRVNAAARAQVARGLRRAAGRG